MRYTTLLGLVIDVPVDAQLERFYDRILGSASGRAAEDLAYGPENPIQHARTPEGLPIWTAAELRDPRWAYLQDAVGRCRAACGELDLGAVMAAPMWSVAEAARSLGVHPVNVRKLIASGELPAIESGGRYLIDRAAVEAHASTGTRAGATTRVPALYVRAGSRGPANLVVVALDDDGRPAADELLRSADGVDEVVIADWREAVILAGKGDKARAIRVRPAHGRAVSAFGLDGLEARGRWELIDKTNNRSEAAEMLRSASERGKAGSQ